MKTSQEFIRKITIIGCLVSAMLLAGCGETANNNLKDKLENVTEHMRCRSSRKLIPRSHCKTMSARSKRMTEKS